MSSGAVLSSFQVGDLIDGRYLLRRDLGEGAAGRVFEAVHTFTHRGVALKISRVEPSAHANAQLRARLTREARTLASVRHPGVVEILDGGFVPNGPPYLVMELLDGRSLEGLIAARGKIGLEDTVAVALQLCDALEAAHLAGIVHRDIKPANIVVVRDHAGREVVKVCDFGIARVEGAQGERLTGIGALIGTPAYMAPEQLLALDDVDKRADVYAVGVTVWECLTGRMPYEGNYQTVLLDVCSTDPVPLLSSVMPEAPPELVEVVRKAMAKDRSDRFGTMRQLRKALKMALKGAREGTTLFGPPPSAAVSSPPDGLQRRKLVRAAYVTPVRLIVGDLVIDGRTEDISAGGLLIICRQICPADSTAKLRIALPVEGTIVSVDVRVRWVRAARADDPGGPRAIGVEFVDPPPEMTASIDKYVKFMTAPEAE